jgi:hypothetical protein
MPTSANDAAKACASGQPLAFQVLAWVRQNGECVVGHNRQCSIRQETPAAGRGNSCGWAIQDSSSGRPARSHRPPCSGHSPPLHVSNSGSLRESSGRSAQTARVNPPRRPNRAPSPGRAQVPSCCQSRVGRGSPQSPSGGAPRRRSSPAAGAGYLTWPFPALGADSPNGTQVV